MGFQIASREEAAALGGIALEAWDREMRAAVAIPTSRAETEFVGGKLAKDFDSKLEWRFWQRLWEAKESGVWSEVDAHSIKVRAIGDASWFTVDFVASDHRDERTIFETKGYLREKDKLRLIGAASRFPEWAWILVTEPKRNRWECRQVYSSGISKEIWCPSWLK